MKNNIGKILKEQGRSQVWLCSQLAENGIFVSRVSVNYWVNNHRQPSGDALIVIADILGIKKVRKLYEEV